MINKDLVSAARNGVGELIRKAVLAAQSEGSLAEGDMPAFTVEIPTDVSHGDFASNIAMVGAKAFRKPPRAIAEIITEKLVFEGSFFARAEIAGPGFINLFLKPEWFTAVLKAVAELGSEYGRTGHGNGKRIMVEFVSANPTGPMHMGNARGGVIGDCLAAAFEASGHEVCREFYLNDAGNQVAKFGISLEARYLQLYKGEEAVPFPENGYHGDDITERAKEFAEIHGDSFVNADEQARQDALVDFALPLNVSAMKKTLAAYRIEYDNWFHESTLHADGSVERTLEVLAKNGMSYEQDGAVWYSATKKGAEKDEVLVRQNGVSTYFSADIAYHYNKLATRGYDLAINIWGADHHGHVARLKGALDAVGLSGDRLDIILMQLVRLMKDGEPYRMSKRSGKSITLSDLLDMVSTDAARFFFNMRDAGAAMDFDLDLAVQQDSQNPVFYVQYAHARICSIEKNLREADCDWSDITDDEYALLTSPEEIELIRKIAQLPSTIISVAEFYNTASLTHYAIDIAGLFHKFYNACRVLGDDKALTRARAALCIATRTTIANVLELMKISAPESM